MNFNLYNQSIKKSISTSTDVNINSFVTNDDGNIDSKTVESFGEEWLKFSSFSEEEIEIAGNQYFDIINETILNKDTSVLDLGCGSGRWTKFIAKKVKLVEAVDPSNAVFSANYLNRNEKNVRVTQASVSNIPFEDNTFDFVICLGVLHHIPNTQQALTDLVKKIKKGGTILLYLYYSLDNRSNLYKFIFKTSSLLRLFVSKMPKPLKKITCDVIAFTIYLPLVLVVRFFQFIFGKQAWIRKIPLSYYSDKSINIIRNDSLDRFGTPLEQRFSKNEIKKMMTNAGLSNIVFSNNEPYWHMTGKKI